jgi:outer membrane protein assembly factor BamD (BamD/ComL family)
MEYSVLRISILKVALVVFGLAISAFAVDRGVLVRVANIYISPDPSSAKLGDVERGREVVVLENSREWLHVEANVTEQRTVSGWILDKGVIRASTPNGDKILYGEAVDSEDQASRRHGRRDAAQDAMRLYHATAEYFPKSPMAGAAMYRSADIRWQLEKADVMSRPSARTDEPFMREEIEEKYMKEVMKKFPGTKWADLAAFELLDNKLCGDWQAQSKCPEKETDLYLKYAKDHPQSPKVSEALYDAAYRQSALIEIYKTETDAKKSDLAKAKAMDLAQRIAQQYPDSDYGARAQRLLYMMQQGIPTYGNEQQ